MASRYAARTEVSSDRSQAELMALIRKHGATRIGWAEEDNRVGVQFEIRNLRLRFLLALPSITERRFSETPTGRTKAEHARSQAYEQEVRRLYRALLLVVKAKFESVESGIETFEEAFLAHIVLPDNVSIGDRMIPAIEDAYRGHDLPPLLPPASGGGS